MQFLAAFIFIFVFVPAGKLLRIFDIDPLRQSIDADAGTYWSDVPESKKINFASQK